MNEQEMLASVEEKVQEVINDIAMKRVDELVLSPEKLSNLVHASAIIYTAIDNKIKSYVSTEIGNQLRCGIYKGVSVDKAFNEVWNEEVEKSLKDRIRQKMESLSKEVFKELFAKMLKSIDS